MTWRRHIAPVVSSLCTGWCLFVGFWIWFTPLHYTSSSGGIQTVIERRFSEVSGNGALPLIIPIVIAGLGTWGAWRGRRGVLVTSALLLAVYTFISGFSIGAAYVPATGLQLLAVGLSVALGSGMRKQAEV